MKKVLLVFLLALLPGCKPEPVFQGKTVSGWRQDLKHRDEMARWHAAEVFTVVGPPHSKKALPELIELLRDSYSFNRIEAAYALAKIGPDAREAVPALMEMLKNPKKPVREAAGEALKKIDPEAAAKAGVE